MIGPRGFYGAIALCLLLVTLISIGLVGLRAEKSIEKVLRDESSKKSQLVADRLAGYLENRIVLLQDLAASPLMANAVMGSGASLANLKDHLAGYRLMGLRKQLYLLDIQANLIHAHNAAGENVPIPTAPWFSVLMDERAPFVVLRYDAESISRFGIAVPVLYNGHVEGVLLALLSQPIESVLRIDDVLDTGAVTFTSRFLDYASHADLRGFVKAATQSIDRLDIQLSYWFGKEVQQAQRRGFMQDVALAIVATMLLAFVVLASVGRVLIINPYVKLAESRQQIAAAKRNNDLLAQAIKASTVGITISDTAQPDLPLAHVNPAFTAITGYSAEEVLGRNCRFLQGRDTDPAKILQLGKAIANQQATTVELLNYRKDGTSFWNLLHVAPVFDESAALVAYVGIQQDVTETKNAQLGLEHTSAKLADQVSYTQAILDTLLDSVIVIDEAGVVQSCNPATERLFGYPAESLIHNNISMLMPSPHQEQHDDYLRRFKASGHSAVVGKRREVEVRHQSGALIDAELSFAVIRRQDVVYYVGVLRDISERKRVERMKNDFVAMVSHELRTPLTAISGSLKLIVGGVLGELPPRMLELIKMADTNSRRLTFLINDLLDIEKIAAGKLNFDIGVYRLSDLLQQSVDSTRSYGAARQVTLTLEDHAPGVQVSVDEQRLMQVMANLLSNAIKFSPSGAPVRVVAERVDNGVRVSVIDQGSGIPEAFRQHIFQKFSQADSSSTRKQGGTGLGLAISRELITRMGGDIDFESVDGCGSTFWLILPTVSK